MPIKFKLPLGDNLNLGSKNEEPKEQLHAYQPIDFNAKENRLQYLLHSELGGKCPPRHHLRVHISDLDPARKWCPREPAILEVYKASRPLDHVGSLQALTHHFGHAGADIVIRQVARSRIYGVWFCTVCGAKNQTNLTNTTGCFECSAGPQVLKHQEVRLYSSQYGVQGSVDLMVDLDGKGRFTLVEIKTEGKDTFVKRTAPEFDHEWRTKGYLWLAAQDEGMKNVPLNLNDARILYVCKNGGTDAPHLKGWGVHGSKSPFKEYLVPRDDAAIQNQLDKVEAMSSWLKAFDASGEAPPRLPPRVEGCTGKLCGRAKRCPVSAKCWSAK